MAGALDYKELEKALRKATGKLGALTLEGENEDHFSSINANALKGGVKAASVKQAKEEAAKARNEAMEIALSPRSLQLKYVISAAHRSQVALATTRAAEVPYVR